MIFTGVREKWAPLYRELKEMAQEALGDFEEAESSAALLWRHRAAFAEVSAKKNGLTIAFPAAARHDEWRPVKILQTSKNRFVHYFEVCGSEQFPAFVEKIAAAYRLCQTAKAPKREITAKYRSIDEYLALFDPPKRDFMQKARETIRRAFPEALEKISWNMPTFYQNGNLIHFCAAKKHLGIYPGPRVICALAAQLAAYKTTKGSIHFPWDAPLPVNVLEEICREIRSQ
jgi:uncharacterized protein YdhG (YjbR/CyaY superfamily)